MGDEEEEPPVIPPELRRDYVLKQEKHFKSRVRFCIMLQYAWYIVMMAKVYAESYEDESTFPKITELQYIWDDYLPLLYFHLIIIYRRRLILTRKHIGLLMAIGYLPLITSFASYFFDFYQRSEEVGCVWFERYPYGMLWYAFLVVSHVLRIISIYNFIYLMLTWMLLQRI